MTHTRIFLLTFAIWSILPASAIAEQLTTPLELPIYPLPSEATQELPIYPMPSEETQGLSIYPQPPEVAPDIQALPAYRVPYSVTPDFLSGKFTASKHPNFVKLGSSYSNRSNMYLQKEAYAAFKDMYKAAKKDGVRLVIRSATRSFKAQRSIWEAKWSGKRKVGGISNIHKVIPNAAQRAKKILEYSSMPGSSRHHWGTEVDLNSFNNQWFSHGKGKKVYNWLSQNAARFGFCQPYSPKGQGMRPSGYNEEKWHWSYMPLSASYTEQAAAQFHDEMFRGFKGAETAPAINIVENYVLGINPDCRIRQ